MLRLLAGTGGGVAGAQQHGHDEPDAAWKGRRHQVERGDQAGRHCAARGKLHSSSLKQAPGYSVRVSHMRVPWSQPKSPVVKIATNEPANGILGIHSISRSRDMCASSHAFSTNFESRPRIGARNLEPLFRLKIHPVLSFLWEWHS